MLGLAWEYLGGTVNRAQIQDLEHDGNGLLLHYAGPKEWIDTQDYCNNREERHILGAMGIGVLGRMRHRRTNGKPKKENKSKSDW